MKHRMLLTKQRLSIFSFVFLLFIILLANTLPLSAFAAETEPDLENSRKTVVVGYTEIPGLSETDGNGRPHGLIIDYLEEISKYTDRKYEYVKTDRIVDDFLEGKFDLIGGNYYLPELEEYFA